MKIFFTKAVVLLFLLAVAATANNPSLRAEPRALHNNAITNGKIGRKKKVPHRSRSLDLHNDKRPIKPHEPPKPPHRVLLNKFPDMQPKKKPPTRQLQLPLPPVSTPPFPDPTVDPELCREAMALELDEIEEDTIDGQEGVWFSVEGTGGFLSATTCTGDSALDSSTLDTVISVYSGSCDSLNFEAYDDDMGSCGYLKSMAYFQTEDGDTYYVNVAPLSFGPEVDGLSFGITVTEIDVPPNTLCETATSVEIDEVVQVEITNFGSSWYTVSGIDGFLAVSTCTEDSNQTGAYADVWSGSCDNMIYETYTTSLEGNCQIGYFESSADEMFFLSAYGYNYDGSTGGTFELKVYEVSEIPNSVCLGATPLELGEVVEGEISMSYGQVWYSLVGNGDDLLITTCTGDSSLDESSFDSYISVSARECNDLRWIASDDEGGKCGYGKSAMILSSVDGLKYHISVGEYMGMAGTFGLKVSAAP